MKCRKQIATNDTIPAFAIYDNHLSFVNLTQRTRLAMEMLSKQLPTTLEEARQQVSWLKQTSTTKKKKQRNC